MLKMTPRHLLFSLSLHASIFLAVGWMWEISRPHVVLGNAAHPVIATFLYDDKSNQLSLAKEKNDQSKKTTIAAFAKKGRGRKEELYQQQTVRQHSQQSQGEQADSLVALLHVAIQAEQRYPAAAEQMQRQGKVKIAFMLYTDGHVSDLEVVQSSGTTSLDAAALEAVKKAVPFKQVNQYLQQAQHYTIDVIFQLA